MTSPARRREAVQRVCEALRVFERRACRVLQQPRSTNRYKPRIASDEVDLTIGAPPIGLLTGGPFATEGKTWSKEASFDFERMGSSSFEKIYELEDIKKVNGNLIADITMNAIPSSKSDTTTIADVKPTYTGSIELNLTKGILNKYQENLVSEWVILYPNSDPNGPPNIITFVATKTLDIERTK